MVCMDIPIPTKSTFVAYYQNIKEQSLHSTISAHVAGNAVNSL